MVVGQDVRPNGRNTLRKVLASSDRGDYESRFCEAEALARSLFASADYRHLPYYVRHDENHCRTVEDYLNCIIWGAGELGPHDLDPSPEEAMYLLSAAWLHDIGLIYGILREDQQTPELTPNSTKDLYRDHEVRTVQYILHVWKDRCSWLENEKTYLTSMCGYHRRWRPFNLFSPVSATSQYDGKPIRLVALTALLRLADICHENVLQPPGSVMDIYISQQMPEEVISRWTQANLITGIEFNHSSREITIVGQCREKLSYKLGEFNLADVIELARQGIDEGLQSVQVVLLSYMNVLFGHVNKNISLPFRVEVDEKRQYLALWPYLLNKPTSSTEAAAALVKMLLFAVEDGKQRGALDESWYENLFQLILSRTQELNPTHFLIRHLRRELETILTSFPLNAESTSGLVTFLEGFLDDIENNSQRIALYVEDVVRANDALLIHGHCHMVAMCLDKLRDQCGDVLYLVKYDDTDEICLAFDENERMRVYAEGLGFDVKSLKLAALPETLDYLARQEKSCRVLLGARGVLQGNKFLCRVGSRSIALATNRAREKGLDAQVIVFTEMTKFLVNGDTDGEANVLDELLLTEGDGPSDIGIISPKIDLVPGDLVDVVVTEEGLKGPGDLAIAPKAHGDDHKNDGKENSPA